MWEKVVRAYKAVNRAAGASFGQLVDGMPPYTSWHFSISIVDGRKDVGIYILHISISGESFKRQVCYEAKIQKDDGRECRNLEWK